MTPDEIKVVLDLHGKWLRDEDGGVRADLRRANLIGADLRRANLRRANLSRAYLSHANLSRAYLRYANLSRANLRGAYLSDADLIGADLSGADLRGADLSRANLIGAYLPNGVKWETYVAELVPQLLTVKGRTLEETRKSFTCHTWENCPMAEAFGVHSLDDIPALYKAEAQLFVTLFDGHALTEEVVFGAKDGEA
jgi:hypothetical protein